MQSIGKNILLFDFELKVQWNSKPMHFLRGLPLENFKSNLYDLKVMDAQRRRGKLFYATGYINVYITADTNVSYAPLLHHRTLDNHTVVYAVGRLSPDTIKHRTVVYEDGMQHLKCSCKEMILTGIPCRHILRVATQLNFEQLPEHYFPLRWCKDPSSDDLSEQYKPFYSPGLPIENSEATCMPMQREEFHLFMLNKTTRKMERFAKQNPGTAKSLHQQISKILDATVESSRTAEESSSHIRNPFVVSTKGAKKKTKKEERSVDKTKNSSRKITCSTCGRQGHTSRSKACPGKPASDSEETVDGELYEGPQCKINKPTYPISFVVLTPFFAADVQEESSPCPFCDKLLPNPWPPKIQEYYSALTGNGSKCELTIWICFSV